MRRYLHCKLCRTRMTRPLRREEDGRWFYLCPCCGSRQTFILDINGLADDWPIDAFKEAVRQGVVSKNGQPLLEADGVPIDEVPF